MAYSPFNWLEGIGKVGPTNLNHLELGLQAAAVVGDAAIPKPAGPATNAGLVWNGAAWVAAKLTNANIDAAAAIDATKIAVPYTTYVPTWTSSVTPPAIGNAGVIARYAQIGKLVHAYGTITFGSTSTYGTGFYGFALPVAALSGNGYSGGGMGIHGTAGASLLAAPAASKLNFYVPATYLGTITLLSQTTPFTWASGDQIYWNITYEAA